MTRFRLFILGLVIVGLIGLAAGWLLLKSEAFWTWGGRRLVHFAQDRLHPELKVRQVKGHPLTGLTFTGITLTAPQGEVLRAECLELRFSLWSFVRREPVISHLAVIRPHLALWQDEDGSLNVSKVLRPRPPPPFQSLNFPQIRVEQGTVAYRGAAGLERFDDLDLMLTLSILHPKRPEQAVLVRRAVLAGATPWGRFRLNTRLTYNREQLNILSLEIREAEVLLATLVGGGKLGAAPSGTVAVELGPLPGATLKRFFSRWPEDAVLKTKFRLDFSSTGLEVAARGELKDHPFILKGKANWEARPGRYEVNLDLGKCSPDLAACVSPELAHKIRDLTPFSAQLSAKGAGLAWPPETLDWTLTAAPFRLGPTQVEALKLTLTGNGQEQSLEGLARGNFGQLAVSAAGPLLAEKKGQAKLEAKELKPALLGLPALQETQLTGGFSGSFRLPGPVPAVSGEITGAGRLQGYQLSNFKATVSYERPRLEVSRAAVRLGDLAAELKGSLSGENLDFQAQGRLAKGALPFQPSLKAAGPLTFQGHLRGSLTDPQLRLSADGRGLAWPGGAAETASLKAETSGWPPRSGHLRLKASDLKTPLAALSQATLACQGQDHRWQFVLQGGDPQGLEARGTADLASRPFSLLVERLGFKLANLEGKNLTPVKVRLLPSLHLEPATFQINDGTVKMEARILDREVSGRLEAQNLPAQLIRLRGHELKGRLNTAATLSGSPGNPVLKGQLTLAPGRWGDFAFRLFETGFAYQDSWLSFSGRLEEMASGPRLVWDGSIPLNLSLLPFSLAWPQDQEVRVLVQGERVNLSLLPVLTREVLEAQGEVDLKAQWQGPLSQPRVTGQIRWGPGTFMLRQSRLPYRLPPGEARLAGETLTLPPVTLESGGGTAVVNGQITLAGFLPSQLNLSAQVQNFKVFSRVGSEAFGTGAVSLTGPFFGPFLKGRLLVNQASFRPGFFQIGLNEDIVLMRGQTPLPPQVQAAAKTPGAAALSSWKIDLDLEAPGNVWVKDKRFNIEVAGQVKLSKLPGEPTVPSGTIKAVKGTIDIQDRPFKLVEGALLLPGRPREPVLLQGRATHEIRDVTLIMEASGPVAKPEVRMSSIPPLPPADLLSYLVFGQPSRSLTQEQYRTVGQQAAGLLGGITAKKFQEFLGKDFPLVGDLYLRGGQESVGVAKSLTQDITVSFERKTDPLARYTDDNQVRLDYRINRYLSVESQVGRRNSGADVFLNLDF